MLLSVGGLLLGADHTGLRRAGVVDPHRLVTDGDLLRFLTRTARRAALLAGSLTAQFGDLDALRLRAGCTRSVDGVAARVGVLRATLLTTRLLATGLRRLRPALGSTLLPLLTLLLTGGTAAGRQARGCVALLATAATGRWRILILRTADFAAARVFVTGQFEIPNHAALGFFVGCVRRTIQQRRVRKNAARRAGLGRRRTRGSRPRCGVRRSGGEHSQRQERGRSSGRKESKKAHGEG